MRRTLPYPINSYLSFLQRVHKNAVGKMWIAGIVIVTILWISIPDLLAQKRGISYGHHSPKDMAVMSPEVVWWYNWSETPESAVAEVYGDYGFDFVPMTWNGSFNENKLRTFLDEHPETKYLLAFNEPNFLDQANMKPSQVAAIWPKLEAIADDYNLEIVGPAVNFCNNCVSENGTTYTDPVQYLDDFFAACPECRVDHIAVHCYMNHASALEWYISLFEKYNKPIWLTEFAGWEYNDAINTPDDQISFMMNAVEFLENEPTVFRYAWFIGRTSGGIQSFPYIDLLGDNGKLTELGHTYKQMPVHDTANVVMVPARIQAEDYARQLGISLRRTSDENGFADVDDLDTDDYLDYRINVPVAGIYDLSLRVASTRRTALRIYVDDISEITQRIPDNEGWDNWTTITEQFELSEGTHHLRLKALGNGFVLNWFEISNSTFQMKDEFITTGLTLTPMPVKDVLIFSYNAGRIKDIQIYNLNGSSVLHSKSSQSIDMSNLKPGIYLVKIETEGQCVFRKVIKS